MTEAPETQNVEQTKESGSLQSAVDAIVSRPAETFAGFDAVLSVINHYMADCCSSWGIQTIVDSPEGDRQDSDCEAFDHEFVDQRCGICGDDYVGDMYFPITGGRYIKVWYVC